MARGSFATVADAIAARGEARKLRKAAERERTRKAREARRYKARKMRAHAVGFTLPAYPRAEEFT